MSEYSYRDDGPRRYRSVRTRERDRGEPDFVEETTFIQRGPGRAPVTDLVYRGRDDSIEDIERDFPPPRAKPARRARSVGRRDYDYDEYDDYYESRRRGRPSRRDSDGYFSDDYDRPPRRERRKSRVGEVLEDLGLGGIAGAVLGKSKDRSRSRHGKHDRYDRRRHSSSSSSSSSRSRSRGGGRNAKWQQAAKAAAVAGAVEAFRSRKGPGAWQGEKGTRVATAALTAAGIDGLIDKEPGHHSKRHIAESAIGGLVSNRLVHGSRSQSRARGRSASTDGLSGLSRSRSRGRSIMDRFRSKSRGASTTRGRSQSRGGGLKGLAAGGAVAAAGKAIYDRVRSKSRRRRSSSSSSNDSYVPTRGRRYRGDDRGFGTGNDSFDDDAAGAAENGTMMRGGGGSTRAASVSSESTTDMEQRAKRMRGKELLTAGLATVATIHAVHGVYNSINASEKRHKLVAEGEMSPEEARKKRSKAFLQDAAAVGIAALGIKGAFSEWKEMNEQRNEVKELELKKRKRKKMRERRAKELRQQHLLGGPYGYNAPMGAIPAGAYSGGPSTYADANPYSAGNLPAPPMGGQPARY